MMNAELDNFNSSFSLHPLAFILLPSKPKRCQATAVQISKTTLTHKGFFSTRMPSSQVWEYSFCVMLITNAHEGLSYNWNNA
jgi:hypothetical protein